MSEVKNIPDGWDETTLNEYLDLLNGYAFKSGDFENEKINDSYLPILKIKNVANGNANHNDVVFHKVNDNLEKYIIKEGDILIALTGNHPSAITQVVGGISRYYLKENALLNQRVGKMYSKNESILNNDFIYYFFKWSNTQFYIANQSSGSASQANISKNDVISTPINLPPQVEQKAIASILTAFDSKIELLQAQNKTLEEIAQTIFTEWFGKYSVDDKLPDGWRVGKLSEIANLKSGFAFKAEDFIEESNFKAIKIKDLKGNGNISLSNVSAITEEITKLDRVQYFKLDEGDILLAMSGNTTGKIGILPSSENEIYLNQRVGKFFMKDKKYNSFLYNFLMSGSFEEKILAMGYGSAQPNINPGQIENIDIIYPDETKMTDYLKISNPIFEKVLKNNTQIQTLTKTRDELLPRLMSGEIRVNEFKV
jgi:type I restriction enzyme, S subunit